MRNHSMGDSPRTLTAELCLLALRRVEALLAALAARLDEVEDHVTRVERARSARPVEPEAIRRATRGR